MTTWRSVPRMIFSIASVKSFWCTLSWPRRAANSAASLTSSARSAPVMPGVEAAICSRSTPSSSGTERVWICEDLHAAGPVGRLHGDAAVEAAGAQQRRVEDLDAVRRADHDHVVRRREAVHLREDLVERLLALVVAAAQPADVARARPADRVELVDEDDRRGGLLGLLEEVAHARRADADDRLHELATRRPRRTRPRPRPRRRARAASCRCPAGRRAARRAGCARRGSCTSPGS